MQNYDHLIKPSRIRKGEATVTVRTAWGTSFEAPAKGPVLASDFQPPAEYLDVILQENLRRQDSEVLIDGLTGKELLERAKETQRKIDDARKENSAYYRTLPRYYQYDRDGQLKKGSKPRSKPSSRSNSNSTVADLAAKFKSN